jgi:hypothetical protein
MPAPDRSGTWYALRTNADQVCGPFASLEQAQSFVESDD